MSNPSHMIIDALPAEEKLNDMIRQTGAYLQSLQNLLSPTENTPHDNLLQLHLQCLPDAASHAATLRKGLDSIKNEIYHIVTDFKHTFEQLIIKTTELNHLGPLKAEPLPIYSRLNQLILKNLKNFHEFLLSLKKLKSRIICQ